MKYAIIVFLLISGAAFADEAIKPSAYVQPNAAAPRKPGQTVPAADAQTPEKIPAIPTRPAAVFTDYKVGVDDVLDISVLQPEQIALVVTVSPDGSITFPYITKVDVKGKTPAEIQEEIQNRLADGYLKYPIVSVSLKQSQSKKFYVYGEVMKPGIYFITDNMTVLKAISEAGGFTKYGSSSRVKILRPKPGTAGYDMIKINMNRIMDGRAQDVVLKPGDIVRVEEGVF